MDTLNYQVLYTEDVIAKRVEEIADQINESYKDKNLEILSFLNGGSIFYADLIRKLRIPVTVHPFGFQSYSPSPLSGEVEVTLDVKKSMMGKHILIIEGVVISGRTPKYIYDMLKLRNPASIEICAVGIKREALTVDLNVKYHAFEFGSEIVVGYGIGEGKEKSFPFLAERKS
jgi:hypoxanthine phosphoribosyltransferase